MELKKGMYVRTLDGICKCVELRDDGIMTRFRNEDGNIYFTNDMMCNPSFDVADLIEEDDLIKCRFGGQTLILQVGTRYSTSYPEKGWVKGVFTPDDEFWEFETLKEEDILQSIVTKEQFEDMQYKVGE